MANNASITAIITNVIIGSGLAKNTNAKAVIMVINKKEKAIFPIVLFLLIAKTRNTLWFSY
ncbi:hypothetical protein ACS386_05550 [Flavobacteriaceae bacterium LMO-SS05]